MKRKYKFYDTGSLWAFRHYFTLDEWLRFKDDILLEKRYLPLNLSKYGIKLQPKRRHIRSIVIRNLKKLRGRIDYYAHQYRKPHRITIIFRPTWEWYLEWRAK